MQSAFQDLKVLIDYIQLKYEEITNEWLEGENAKVNLRKAQIADVDTGSVIYNNIMAYIKLLNKRDTEIICHACEICSCRVMNRIKNKNSIRYKIQNYKTEKHEFGKISVNKCINDLFGFRIILEDEFTYDEIKKFIQDTYHDKYKCIDSSKGDYKATHIYFKEGNLAFQWELQIWNACDARNNLVSHKKYKQGYTEWENKNTR